MKRLLRISFDLSLLTLIPILSWFALGMLVDKSLINVFTLIYPIQFVWYILKSIFSTGANISKEKDKNENAVMSGIFIGAIVGLVIFGSLIANIDNYIRFMNMDPVLYHEFAIYAMTQLYIQLIFNFYIEKLYFENKNKLANKYSFLFNAINFIVLVVALLVFENTKLIILIALASICICMMVIIFKESDKFELKLNIFSSIKYDSVELINNIAFFFIFLFGLSNAFEYGAIYATAITFVSLITDTQWDVFTAVTTVAKIDISEGNFNYYKHRNDAYKLGGLLLLSSTIMFLTLYSFYDINIYITLAFILLDSVGFILFPIYKIKTCFLQLEYSSLKMSVNKIFASLLRLGMSFLKTPYCTGIGHVTSTVYQFFTVNYIFKSNFKIAKDGRVIRRIA